jgi:hypothetical protein
VYSLVPLCCGLCMCRRGFNRRVIFWDLNRVVKIICFKYPVNSLVREGGLCLCRRGFNRRVIFWDLNRVVKIICFKYPVNSLVREGGLCLCRRGFNRRVLFDKKRFQPPSFIYVSAVSTAEFYLTRRGFNHRVIKLPRYFDEFQQKAS